MGEEVKRSLQWSEENDATKSEVETIFISESLGPRAYYIYVVFFLLEQKRNVPANVNRH